jgi:pimeloyl-ACP methyl ester carboxylesterase
MVPREPHIPVDALAGITAPTLVLVGDDDMVTLEHSIALYRAIPDPSWPSFRTSHAAMMRSPHIVNRLVLDFLTNEPVPTMMALRRRLTKA